MVKRYTTSTEFVKWKVYQLEEPNEFNPLYWYLALIATEVARSNAKHPERIKLKDRILKFAFNSTTSATNESSSADTLADVSQERMNTSKRAWLAMTGFFKVGNRKRKRK